MTGCCCGVKRVPQPCSDPSCKQRLRFSYIPSQARNRLYALYLMETDFAKHAPFGGRAHRLMAVRPWAYAHWGSRGDERGCGASAREMGARNTKERAD